MRYQRIVRSLLALFFGAGLAAAVLHAQAPAPPQTAPPGQSLEHPQGTNAGIFAFTGRCAACHDNGTGGAPDRYTLNQHTPEAVLATMRTGAHATHAEGLTEFEKRVVAVYIGGRPLGSSDTGDAAKMPNHCESAPAFTPFTGSEWNGWGADASNSRYQPSPGLTAEATPKLALKWAFGFPYGNSSYGQPSVVGGRVFVGSDTGFVYALDAKIGCVHWSFRASAGVRTAPSVGPGSGTNRYLVYFGDIRANVYAVNAETGAEVWKARLDTHPIARVTGAPKLVAGRLYVPLSSLEESGAGNPSYPCCTFRGGLAAYDALTGKQLWKSYSVAEAPKKTKVTSLGTQLWAPAGAGVWSSPTVDLARRMVYVATGNGYTEPADIASDAVIAYDIDSGKRMWVKQVMALDHYVRDCPGIYRPNVPTDDKSETCPDDLGPDFDFGNAPILRTMPDGKSYIVIGQKSGDAWGLDPDKQGEIVWRRQVGLGWENGGGAMMWGSAADQRLAYFPVTRTDDRLGLAAVGIGSGEVVWRAMPPAGGGAPVTVMPGVVFMGASTGTVYGYSTANGQAIWSFETDRTFDTVNGVEARGGGINAAGPVVAGGMLFVSSGYSDLGGGRRGNVLLAFAVP
ncbi:MAG: PQQ-binding-like beta-propeller repeat protein [Acidobacteria bacterium]|nr:PQQ-binding-like beta-propeller repeat protein [Acidobacteriota bacterium]